MKKYATQGHRYKLFDTEVLALESGNFVRVARIDRSKPWPLTEERQVYANVLTPMPMVYFAGQVPS